MSACCRPGGRTTAARRSRFSNRSSRRGALAARALDVDTRRAPDLGEQIKHRMAETFAAKIIRPPGVDPPVPLGRE